MKYCKECGSKLPDAAKFCEKMWYVGRRKGKDWYTFKSNKVGYGSSDILYYSFYGGSVD